MRGSSLINKATRVLLRRMGFRAGRQQLPLFLRHRMPPGVVRGRARRALSGRGSGALAVELGLGLAWRTALCYARSRRRSSSNSSTNSKLHDSCRGPLFRRCRGKRALLRAPAGWAGVQRRRPMRHQQRSPHMCPSSSRKVTSSTGSHRCSKSSIGTIRATTTTLTPTSSISRRPRGPSPRSRCSKHR